PECLGGPYRLSANPRWPAGPWLQGGSHLYLFCCPLPTGASAALIRLAWEGSKPIVTFTVMPGFKSATVARCPFTLISVNCVIVNALVVFASLTVIAFPFTLDMTGC